MFQRKLKGTTKSVQIEDGSLVFFSSREPFKVSKFSNKEEAEEMYTILSTNRHPNIASVYPVFQVDKYPSHYFLPYELHGKRLDDAIERGKFIHRDIWITEFYRQLLLALFEVLKFINTVNKIEWEASLANIYVLELDKPMFTLVGFKKRGATSLTMQCEALSLEVIRKINERCNWTTPPMEMVEFCKSLESKLLWMLKPIAFSPIMMSRAERYSVVNNGGDFLKIPFRGNIAKLFKGWEKIVKKDDDLRQLRKDCQVRSYIPSPTPTPTVVQVPWKIFKELNFGTLPCGLMVEVDGDGDGDGDGNPYQALLFFCQTIADEVTTPGLPTSEDVMHRFESTFPNVLLELTKVGRDLENCHMAVETSLVPRKEVLEELFMEGRN